MDFTSAKAYAKHMLEGDRLRLSIGLQPMRCSASWVEVVLHREGAFQTQLVIVLPGVVVPQHRHRLCESVDIAVAGSGALGLGDLRMTLGPRLLRVPRLAWHGGTAGPDGAAWLSFQHWGSAASGFISDDWEPHDAQ